MKKLLATLLALCMVFTMMPTVARAEEAIPETEIVAEELPFQINPLYEGLISEADLDIPEVPKPDPSQVLPQATTYLTVEEAGAQIRQNLKNREESFSVNVAYKTSNGQTVGELVLAAAMVHTGNAKEGDYLLWQYAGWGGSYTRSYNSTAKQYEYTLNFTVSYYTTAAQEAELDTAISKLISSLGVKSKSDYEKICAVYDWICANVTYDHANLEDETYTLKFTAYAAMMDKTAVCQGYALLFYRLMLELGVDNRLIAGIGNGGAHGWNIVQLGDYYYSVDSTWDAGQTEYSFFLTSTWNFLDHYRYLEYETWEFHEEYPMAAENYDPNVTAQIDPYIYMGTCGDEAYWLLMRDGTLAIFGNGAVIDSTSSTTDLDLQWEYWTGHITNVVVDEGITYIGENAFRDEDKLEYIELSSTVTEIGEAAFYGCDMLSDLWLSEGLITIGTSAFSSCPKLLDVEFPDTLQEIGDRAFYGAGWITSVNLPDSVTTLGRSAFAGCPELKSVYIPSSVTSIEEYAFSSCPKLEKVELHCGTVKEYMFSSCSALTEIVFGSEVTTVEAYAFNNCDALTEINYPAHIGVFNGFADCDGLVTLTIPEGITEIGNYACESCDALTTVNFPTTLKRIGGGAFSNCVQLTGIQLNEGLEYIGGSAFYATAVTELDFPASLTEIQGSAFGSCLGLTKLYIPKTIQLLSGFQDCTNLSEVVLEEGLNEVSGSAFYGCTSLTEVKLPSSLKAIGRDAFKFCSNLEAIEFPEGLETIEWDAFTGCNKITEVTIPKSVTALCGFQDCDGLVSVTLNNTGAVLSYAFYGCDNLQNLYIGNNVTEIQASAFQKCVSLRELTVPSSVGDVSGFGSCTDLETVRLYNTGRIRGYAFSGCRNLKNVEITNATAIDSNAFSSTAVESLVVPATVKTIGYMAFNGAAALKEIKFLGDCPEFDSAAFKSFSDDVIATAYYPAGNPTWTEDMLQNYGGTITWVSYVPPCPGHTYESVVTAPTCTERGYTTYICTNCGYSYVGNYTDTVDHSYVAVVTAPTCSEQGYTTYTCTNCGESYVGDYTDPVDHNYEDGTCIWCGDETYTAEWKSATTSLNGTIDLNIYVVLSENLMDEEDAFIRFSYGNKVVDVPIAEGVESVSNGVLRYRYSCPMYAKEVSEIVTVQVMKGNEAIGSALEYSIVTYCMNRINKSTNPAQVALCKALLNYASAAQISLNYNTENLANAQLAEADKILPDGIDVSGYAASNIGSETGIKTKSATLMLESEVSVRVYFTLEEGYDISDFTFTIDGKVVEPQKNSTGWFIETDGIAAKNLDQMMEFSVGGITVTYGPMSYVNSKLTNSKTNADTLNLVKSLYAYWQAAEALLG